MTRDDLLSYLDLYNAGKFADAVTSGFTPDAEFWTTRIALRGRQQIIDWLTASHQGYAETLTPTSVIMEPDGAALELDQTFTAHEDLSHFFVQPLKKGEVLRTRGVAWFLGFRAGKIRSLKEYRLLYRCDPRLFMVPVR